MTNHVQCKLQKGMKEGIAYQTTWLPEKFAWIGKLVDLKQDDGTWDPCWVVIETYDTLDSKYVEDRSRDFKRTRKASDI